MQRSPRDFARYAAMAMFSLPPRESDAAAAAPPPHGIATARGPPEQARSGQGQAGAAVAPPALRVPPFAEAAAQAPPVATVTMRPAAHGGLATLGGAGGRAAGVPPLMLSRLAEPVRHTGPSPLGGLPGGGRSPARGPDPDPSGRYGGNSGGTTAPAPTPRAGVGGPPGPESARRHAAIPPAAQWAAGRDSARLSEAAAASRFRDLRAPLSGGHAAWGLGQPDGHHYASTATMARSMPTMASGGGGMYGGGMMFVQGNFGGGYC